VKLSEGITKSGYFLAISSSLSGSLCMKTARDTPTFFISAISSSGVMFSTIMCMWTSTNLMGCGSWAGTGTATNVTAAARATARIRT